MGHRANFVLIKNGKAQAFYDHWGALACTLSLEQGAKRLWNEVQELNERVDELMDWAFAEGGFLIDYDERVCIAFGSVDVDADEMPEEYQADVRATLDAYRAGWGQFVRHIEKGWRGYTMIWDDRGVDAFAKHLERRKITSIKTQKPSHPKSYAKAKPDVVVVPEVTPKGKSSTSTKRVTKKKVT
jgi:hypothetical protein